MLFNGDCLEVMDKLIEEGVKVDAVITDPPYGTTACKWDVVIPFEEMWKRLTQITKDDGAIVLFGSEPFSSLLRCSNLKMYKYDWVYHKSQATNFLNAKKQPLRNHENVMVFYKRQPTYNPQMTVGKPYVTISGGCSNSVTDDVTICRGGYKTVNEGVRYPLSVLPRMNVENSLHPTQKPVRLLEYLVSTYTNEGDTVLDFTMGSGTTGVACANLKRNFIGIDKDTEYFEIAYERIKKFLTKHEK